MITIYILSITSEVYTYKVVNTFGDYTVLTCFSNFFIYLNK